MHVHLVNPSEVSFGIGVITPRWLFVLAAATPAQYGEPLITDETLEPFDESRIQPGDVVGIGIHTGNAYRGLEVGRLARERGAWVVYGGIHATLYPEEAHQLGAAHSVVKAGSIPALAVSVPGHHAAGGVLPGGPPEIGALLGCRERAGSDAEDNGQSNRRLGQHGWYLLFEINHTFLVCEDNGPFRSENM